MEFDFSKIEAKWQKRWEDEKIFVAKENSDKSKYYVLEMFPYPSGEGLHMGHAFNFVLGDIIARKKLMEGYNLLHPVGYDSLGLPAENAAIKVGIHPSDYIEKSMKNFAKQEKTLGISYDWSRMISTADPKYYKWDQWIFLKMLEKGLAYQKKSAVNWCSKCNTVLANEQAQTGNCDLCGTKVEVKHLNQWFLKITDYADELLSNHEKLNWPSKTIAMQKNWIGKSFGVEINFKINGKNWPIFTTRPDTIFGVTFMVVSAHHNNLMELVTDKQKDLVEEFLKKLGSVSEKELEDMEKEGVFTGSYAINPITNDKIPVYAGNFVVADYGAGMVMAVPAHDQRDFEFAKKYEIPIKQVIKGEITETRAYTEKGELVNSGEFDGLRGKEAIDKITDWLISKNLGKRTVNFKLRDWGISRQRYWGTPIPVIHCDKCGAVGELYENLPISLPKDVKFGEGNPLETNESWIKTKCPNCGGDARRETDTMDTFVNSSWYFFRYCDSKNDSEIFDKEKVKKWCPVDLYIGGAEHACMHLIYSRFYTKFLRDIGLVDFGEATPRLFHQGMINDDKGEKMSKSKGNVVEPLETMAKYGVDSTRYFLVSVASPDKGFNWTDSGINGATRFVNKIMDTFEKINVGVDSKELEFKINDSIKKIGEQIDKLDYRRSTIVLRELFDFLSEVVEASKDTLEKSLKLLCPFCPHIAEELWEKIGGKGLISIASWPTFDDSKLKKDKSVDLNLNEKIVQNLSGIVSKFKENNELSKIHLYVMPFEFSKINKEFLSKEFGCEVFVYSTSDKNKYDPENKSRKAVPKRPGIYLE